MFRRLITLVFCVCGSIAVSCAQGAAVADSVFSNNEGRGVLADSSAGVLDRVVGWAECIFDALTIEREGWSLALYPAGSYSGRQGFAVGVMPMVQFYSAALPRAATVTPTVLVSTKKMFEVQCDVDLFLPRGWDVTAKFETFRQPDDLYAVGNEKHKSALCEYDFRRTLFTMDVLKGIGSVSGRWQVGPSVDVDHYSFSNICVADSAFLGEVEELIGSGSGANYGLGGVLGLDTRDDVLFPRSGWLVRVKGLYYVRLAGRGHRFGSVSLDVRRYVPLAFGSVLAWQAYGSVVWDGDEDALLGVGVPFVKMPSCGGSRLGRAIGHNLKYVDRGAWLVQGEWRVPLFWRLGATGFVGCGNVCGGLADCFRMPHFMGGVGLRFAVFPGKGLNLRLDGGVSSRGDRAIYFNVREAF